jgi:hypothetical protein
MTSARALVFGTLTVGVLDAADAMVFFGLRGVSPLRVLQSIASGLLGRAAFQGGLATAALGTLLHFFIAFAIVAVFFAASRRISWLVRRPVLSGLAYGLVAYLVMSQVVVPLSAAPVGPRTPAIVLNGVLIHMLGVGLPAALFARASADPGPARE